MAIYETEGARIQALEDELKITKGELETAKSRIEQLEKELIDTTQELREAWATYEEMVTRFAIYEG